MGVGMFDGSSATRLESFTVAARSIYGGCALRKGLAVHGSIWACGWVAERWSGACPPSRAAEGGQANDLLRLRAMLAQLERSGSCVLRRGGSGYLWRLGGLSYTYCRSATPVCMCPTSSVRRAPFYTPHPNATPVCMCGSSRGLVVRVCMSGACCVAPGTFGVGSGFSIHIIQSAPLCAHVREAVGLEVSVCTYGACVCVVSFWGEVRSLQTVGFLRGRKRGGGVSHALSQTCPIVFPAVYSHPRGCRARVSSSVCCTFCSRVVKECNACSGPGLAPVQAPAPVPSTPTCTSFAVCSV